MRETIAKIIDPHSFLPDNSGDDLIAEMVKQGKDLALRKAARVIEALSADQAKGLPIEPKRAKLDTSEMKFGTCPQCGTRNNLARSEDDNLICGSCADGNYLAEWIDYGRSLRLLAAAPQPNPSKVDAEVEPEEFHIIFDGFPAPDGPRFIEVENASGRSINAGEWRKREDGFCELVIKAGGRANG